MLGYTTLLFIINHNAYFRLLPVVSLTPPAQSQCRLLDPLAEAQRPDHDCLFAAD